MTIMVMIYYGIIPDMQSFQVINTQDFDHIKNLLYPETLTGIFICKLTIQRQRLLILLHLLTSLQFCQYWKV